MQKGFFQTGNVAQKVVQSLPIIHKIVNLLPAPHKPGVGTDNYKLGTHKVEAGLLKFKVILCLQSSFTGPWTVLPSIAKQLLQPPCSVEILNSNLEGKDAESHLLTIFHSPLITISANRLIPHYFLVFINFHNLQFLFTQCTGEFAYLSAPSMFSFRIIGSWEINHCQSNEVIRLLPSIVS